MKSECCGADTQVLDSRHGPLNTIRRRRRCTKCMERFTTHEMNDTDFEKSYIKHKELLEFKCRAATKAIDELVDAVRTS